MHDVGIHLLNYHQMGCILMIHVSAPINKLQTMQVRVGCILCVLSLIRHQTGSQHDARDQPLNSSTATL